MENTPFEVVKVTNLEDSPAFWNTDETNGYRKYQSGIDGRSYKIWIGDINEKFQKKWWYTITNQQETANTLAKVRKDILKLLTFLHNNPELWYDNPIAFGLYHVFDLQLTDKTPYMEMRPNDWGGLGLNKPREYQTIKTEIDNKSVKYDLGTKRVILLTLRNQKTGELLKYSTILDLAIHEVTHTICNDVKWVPEWKGGNHRDPYPSYHRFMRKYAKQLGLINSV